MPSLLICDACHTPLLSTIDLNNPAGAASALELSHLCLRGNGYATNVYIRGRGCPICGWQSSNVVGVEPTGTRRAVTCRRELHPVQPGLHAEVHLREDYRLGFLNGKSGHYALVHSALRHYVLGPGSMTLGDSIGVLGLMNPSHASETMTLLCNAVLEVTGSIIEPSAFEVTSWEIQGGVCAVVVPPRPQNPAEAYLVGIVAQATATELLSADLPSLTTTPQLFVLEKTRTPSPRQFPAMLCQWRSASRREYYDNERRNFGWGSNPVVADFLDSIERVMVSGLWA